MKNWNKSHFIDKTVRDEKNFLCQTVVSVVLFCGIGVSFPEIIGTVNHENKQTNNTGSVCLMSKIAKSAQVAIY